MTNDIRTRDTYHHRMPAAEPMDLNRLGRDFENAQTTKNDKKMDRVTDILGDRVQWTAPRAENIFHDLDDAGHSLRNNGSSGDNETIQLLRQLIAAAGNPDDELRSTLTDNWGKGDVRAQALELASSLRTQGREQEADAVDDAVNYLDRASGKCCGEKTQPQQARGGEEAPARGGERGPAAMDEGRAAEVLRNNFQLLDTAAGIGKKDGLVSKEDLQAILENPGAPQELKDAASFLLENPAAFNALENREYNGELDGLIGRGDVAVADDNNKMSPIDAAAILKEGFQSLDTDGSGSFGREDLERITQDPNAAPHLKAAARKVLDNPELMAALDDAAKKKGTNDGQIAEHDLSALLERAQQQQQQG